MWSDLIVLSTPDFSQHFCLLQRREDFSVEEFIPELPIEALDITILPRAALRDQQRPDARLSPSGLRRQLPKE